MLDRQYLLVEVIWLTIIKVTSLNRVVVAVVVEVKKEEKEEKRAFRKVKTCLKN